MSPPGVSSPLGVHPPRQYSAGGTSFCQRLVLRTS